MVELLVNELSDNELDNASTVRYQENSVCIYENDSLLGIGTLLIYDNFCRWRSSKTDQIMDINYEDIGVHAICRDKTRFPQNCIYLMVDKFVEYENSENVPTDIYNEIRFVPQNEASIDTIFNTMIQFVVSSESDIENKFSDYEDNGCQFDEADEETNSDGD
ncbi:hypothetical protein A3Q56_06841 [Intoshia linei]|uniref:Methylosome subunit pICln n=1 Tax=Intoshia linei TaxID=1819745 RepID=A0A177AUE6_9BILA|nr:hypothetical protein A3Q56_06841 [Intoshia linei]